MLRSGGLRVDQQARPGQDKRDLFRRLATDLHAMARDIDVVIAARESGQLR